ncbi:MAG: beta-lactamase family protein [Xanthomonadales bacterium]|nr:beta-lactamase family protein [Xanthomonadales bacterium]
MAARLVCVSALVLALCASSRAGAETRKHTSAAPTAKTQAAAVAYQQLPPQRVKAALRDFGHWLDAIQGSGRVTGMSSAIIIGDKVRFERSFGYTDVSTHEKVKPTTVFRLASLSKAFSSALAGLLVRDGYFAWDTKIADVLPFFKLKNEAAAEKVTVRDILSQRVGLPHNTYDHKLENDVPYRQLVRELNQVDMTCGVGECYAYQNIAFSLLGDLVYAKTGDFFSHAVAKRLFQPLGMHTATFGRSELEASASWAHPHVRGHHGWVAVVPKPNYYRVMPAAGVNASIRDMEPWLIAQMGGRPKILPPALLKQLHTPEVDTPGQANATPWRRARLRHAGYALGWRSFDYSGHTMVYHAGAVEGYRTIIAFMPEYRIGMVMLWNCNSVVPGGLVPMLFDRLLGLPQVDWANVKGARRASARRAHQR